MPSIVHARQRGLSARSAARRCAFLLFGLAALAGSASGASAAVDEDERAAPSIGRPMAEDAGEARATRRARGIRAKRRQHGRSAYRRLAAGTPDHAPAMRHVAHAAAGEAARDDAGEPRTRAGAADTAGAAEPFRRADPLGRFLRLSGHAPAHGAGRTRAILWSAADQLDVPQPQAQCQGRRRQAFLPLDRPCRGFSRIQQS